MLFLICILPLIIFLCFVLLEPSIFAAGTSVAIQFTAAVVFVTFYRVFHFTILYLGYRLKIVVLWFVASIFGAALALYLVSLLPLFLIFPESSLGVLWFSVLFWVADLVLLEACSEAAEPEDC